ncbi:MAG: Hsp20 family protein [Rhodospirillales bacterium]|nr:Hsp20 family protein [Rhodospirillales bacterium]MBO6787461.1 Hsp20 family protein [Rhodospirillales bacterium]
MRTIDFSPLFRHSVGFDRMQRLLDSAAQTEQNTAYPPYNIEQLGDNGYQITLAVAGFSDDDIDITLTDRTLVVSGKMNDGDEERKYLHRGIAGRAFERRFELADHIQVQGAKLENGLLHVALERVVPESEKPRKIEIAAGSGAKAIEQKAA